MPLTYFPHIEQGVDRGFYRMIIASGDQIKLKKLDNGVVQFGVSAAEMLRGDKGVTGVKVNYNFVSQAIKRNNESVDPKEVTNCVRSIAHAACIPPWSKSKWDDAVFSGFMESKVHYQNNRTIVNTDDDMRIVFTHQLSRKLEVKHSFLCAYICNCVPKI